MNHWYDPPFLLPVILAALSMANRRYRNRRERLSLEVMY